VSRVREYLDRFVIRWFSTARYWSDVKVAAAQRRGRNEQRAHAGVGDEMKEEDITPERREFLRHVQSELGEPDSDREARRRPAGADAGTNTSPPPA
jgi:hypothetical protein